MDEDWDSQFENKRVLIELTDKCNLNCRMCCNRKSPHGIAQGFMDIKLFDRILSEINLNRQWSLELFWLGESLLHPEFDHILEIALRRLENTNSHVNLHTNGSILDEKKQRLILQFGERFPFMTISIDAVHPETHKEIRGGDLETINKNLKEFLLRRKEMNAAYPKLNLQFIIMEQNAMEAKAFAEYWAAFYSKNGITGLDNLFFKRLEVHDIEKQKEANKLFDGTIERFNLFSTTTPSVGIISKEKSQPSAYWFEEKSQKRQICAAPFKNPVIRWDGEVTVCCFDDIFFYTMGNLKNSSLRDIWYGEKMDAFRKKHIERSYDELLTKDGWAKCKACIGYYFPQISEPEIEHYRKAKGLN